MKPAPPTTKNFVSAIVSIHPLVIVKFAGQGLLGRFPFGRRPLERWVADQEVPNHGANPSVWGVMRSGEAVGMITHASATSPYSRPSLPTMPKIFAPHGLRVFERADQVHGYVLLFAAATTEKIRTASRAPRRDTLSHSEKLVSQPSSFTRAVSSENVVGRAIRFERAQLAKVVDRVTGMAGRAADAQDEQPPRRRELRPSRQPNDSMTAPSSALTSSALSFKNS